MGIITIGGSSMRQIAISQGRIGRVNGLTVLLSIANWFSVSFIAKGMLWPYVAFCLSGGYFLHRMAADKARELARRERSKVRRAAGILLINDDGTFQGVPQDDGTYALPVVLLEPAEDTIAGAHRAASKELGLRVELLGLPYSAGTSLSERPRLRSMLPSRPRSWSLTDPCSCSPQVRESPGSGLSRASMAASTRPCSASGRPPSEGVPNPNRGA